MYYYRHYGAARSALVSSVQVLDRPSLPGYSLTPAAKLTPLMAILVHVAPFANTQKKKTCAALGRSSSGLLARSLWLVVASLRLVLRVAGSLAGGACGVPWVSPPSFVWSLGCPLPSAGCVPFLLSSCACPGSNLDPTKTQPPPAPWR